MAVNLSPIGGVAGQFFDNNGNPLSGGKLYTYSAGTTTPQVTYTSATGVTANSNPIILNSGGRVPAEIWLTDGLQYKFVLYTSADALIGSWDNIIGINSNFVNFVTAEEVQTATAGQTVFTLTTMQYQPGTNNLVVYVDGVNQVEGGTYSFVETSSTVVTFTAGLHLGAIVKFVSAETLSTGVTDAALVAFTGFKGQVGNVQDLADDDGSDWVGFLPDGTGAVAQSVQDKLRETVSVKDFGAVGDGVTDDSLAVQSAIDSVVTLGGNLLFPAGVYLFESQVTIDRTYAPSGGNVVGERNLIISGYGAEIRTTGAISAFEVLGGWLPNHNCLIEGFTIYHRGNTQAVGGIRMIGAGLVTCKEVSVVVSNSLPAGYAAFSMENADPADSDTGCFWNLIDQCSARPWSGAEGFCDYGVKLMGAANATTLRNNTFSGSNTHVILMPHPGQIISPNSVNIDGNFFEGPSTAIGIEINNLGVVYHASGTRITNNRFEAIDTAVELTGTGTTVQVPTYMSGNYGDTSVTNYLVNSLNIPVVLLDFDLVGAPIGAAKMVNNEGVVIESQNSSYDPLSLVPANLNKGLALKTQAGAFLGGVIYSNAAGGNGMQLAGSFTPDYRPLTIKGCQGIAARDTSANNLAGIATFAANTSVSVSLPIAETDANYLIFFDNPANQTLWVTAKTTTGFTINSSVSNSTTVGWLLIRHL